MEFRYKFFRLDPYNPCRVAEVLQEEHAGPILTNLWVGQILAQLPMGRLTFPLPFANQRKNLATNR